MRSEEIPRSTHRQLVEPEKGTLGLMHDPFNKPMHFCNYETGSVKAFADGVPAGSAGEKH